MILILLKVRILLNFFGTAPLFQAFEILEEVQLDVCGIIQYQKKYNLLKHTLNVKNR